MPESPPPQAEGLEGLIGAWRTEGEILSEDGTEVIGRVEGSDVYEWLGPWFVIHRVDVTMDGAATRALEIIYPYDERAGGFPTRAHGDDGSVDDAIATVADDGVGTFRAAGGAARSRLTIAADGRSMRADWERAADGAETWTPWMRIGFTRTRA